MFNKNGYNNLHPLSHHLHHTADEIFFHHHEDILSGHYFAAAATAPAVDAASFYHHQDTPGLINADPSATCSKTTKKDRHSKIYTSQGPRDRRVRLSIGVARRFFDLQEILGFDKPSKTLDWLLTNSKNAISDLMQTKDTENGAVSSSPSESDSAEDSRRKLAKQQDLAKESRAKARARARERTREKMCFKQMQQDNDFNTSSNNNSSNNVAVQQQLDQFCRISGHSDSIFQSHPPYELGNYQDLIQQESIVIKRKVKHFVPSPNYISPTENWDICAILDSHKFINR